MSSSNILYITGKNIRLDARVKLNRKADIIDLYWNKGLSKEEIHTKLDLKKTLSHAMIIKIVTEYYLRRTDKEREILHANRQKAKAAK